MTFSKPIKRNAGITAQRRKAKHRRLARNEREHKAEARARDGGPGFALTGRCRFPICGCARFNYAGPGTPAFVEVSHLRHKGMGGDPTGERSQPELMICLCAWRHKESRFSVDKKNLRWVPLTDAGANGPVTWEMFRPCWGWAELARESAVQVLDRFAPGGEELLLDLAEMRN